MFVSRSILDTRARRPWNEPRLPRRAHIVLTSILFLAIAIPSLADEPMVSDEEIPLRSRIPMYGQPDVEQLPQHALADSMYVQATIALVQGDRRVASNAVWSEGERFRSMGQLNVAMSRYNQSWLLDPTNYRPYWGFGRVLLQNTETAAAIHHLEEAWRLSLETDPNVTVEATLATAYSLHAAIGRGTADEASRKYFALATKHFEECVRRDPEYWDGWVQWALGLQREGKYADAWKKVKKARSLGAAIPPSFLKTLGDQMPEPK